MDKAKNILRLLSEIKDQYDEEIPDDLVVLPDASGLGEENIKVVEGAKWYEVDGVLMASAKEINYLSEFDPADTGIDLSKAKVNRVDDVLKRYSEEDGFYRA